MYKNIITVILSSIFGFFIVYIVGIFYFYVNLDKERPYHFKNIRALEFHKKYTSQIHHLSWMNINKINSEPESSLFTIYNKFNNNKNFLIQGDSYVETLSYYEKTNSFFKNFSKKENIGLINAGIGSYSPSLMSVQLDILEKDFNILPNVIVAYFDQSDMGDEICRYKNKKIYNKNNKLIKIQEEKYSRNIFNYTVIHQESAILLSNKSNITKSIQMLNFNLKFIFLKQSKKVFFKIKSIKKNGWAGRKLKKECTWSDIERPLVDNNPTEILYFSESIKEYINKILEKKHIEKIILVTFPHRANLFPVTNQIGKKIFYKVDVGNIVEKISKNNKKIDHLNFTSIIKGKEKYLYDNGYLKFDPHLNEEFLYSLFAKEIANKIEKYLNKFN